MSLNYLILGIVLYWLDPRMSTSISLYIYLIILLDNCVKTSSFRTWHCVCSDSDHLVLIWSSWLPSNTAFYLILSLFHSSIWWIIVCGYYFLMKQPLRISMIITHINLHDLHDCRDHHWSWADNKMINIGEDELNQL